MTVPFHLRPPETFTPEILSFFAESSNQEKRLVAARDERTPKESLKNLCADTSLKIALSAVANTSTTFEVVSNVWSLMPASAAWSFLLKPEKNLTVPQYAELYKKRDSPFVTQRAYNSEPERKALAYLLGFSLEEASVTPLEWLVSMYEETI